MTYEEAKSLVPIVAKYEALTELYKEMKLDIERINNSEQDGITCSSAYVAINGFYESLSYQVDGDIIVNMLNKMCEAVDEKREECMNIIHRA